ncbi:MAG: cytidine deaminase [Halanaerobiaceae bacterium]|jgi:cytidine deaminase|nr:cytidine deaminase [Halanaerobiaceae bacterium]
MDEKEIINLIQMAKNAREYSYSPYSDFPVGAALLCEDGTIYTGTNIENASYGLSNCAERTAVFKAVSEGKGEFKAIAVVADTERPVPPCGACRQVIQEFGEDVEVIIANLKGDYRSFSIKELLPGAFSRKDLENGF